MSHGLRESTIRDGLGHIQIFTAEHFRRDEVHVLDTGIENWRQVAAAIASGAHSSHVRGVAPRIEFYGMVSNGQKSAVYVGNAVDPASEQSLGFQRRLDAGRDLSIKPDGEVEAIIGVGLAKSMSVKVGDGLTVMAVTADGALNGVDVQVVGIANHGLAELDQRYLRMNLTAVQRLLFYGLCGVFPEALSAFKRTAGAVWPQCVSPSVSVIGAGCGRRN